MKRKNAPAVLLGSLRSATTVTTTTTRTHFGHQFGGGAGDGDGGGNDVVVHHRKEDDEHHNKKERQEQEPERRSPQQRHNNGTNENCSTEGTNRFRQATTHRRCSHHRRQLFSVKEEKKTKNKHRSSSCCTNPVRAQDFWSREHERRRSRTNADDDDDDDDADELHQRQQHPYGILPAGNRFLIMEEESVEEHPNSRLQSALLGGDETWMSVLQYCTGRDLALLSETCHYFYAACHQPELWRDLVLQLDRVITTKTTTTTTMISKEEEEEEGENKDAENQETSTAGAVTTAAAAAAIASTWKDTYVHMVMMMSRDDDSNKKHRAAAGHSHKPLRVRGVYSDYFYRLYACRSFAIPEAWLQVDDGSSSGSESGGVGYDTVPVVDNDDDTNDDDTVPPLTREEFFEAYEIPNRPVLLRGIAKSWKACREWKNFAYLRSKCFRRRRGAASNAGANEEEIIEEEEERSFRATSGGAPAAARFTISAYQQYCQRRAEHLEEAPLYLFDRTALSPGSDLWKDYYPDMQRTCPFWDPEYHHGNNGRQQRQQQQQQGEEEGDEPEEQEDHCYRHDLFSCLGEGRRPDHTWLICGPRRSGSVFHIDPNATHAWNATITGRKRWIFYPPGRSPPGVHPSPDGDQVALPLSVGEWLYHYWDDHVAVQQQQQEQQRRRDDGSGDDEGHYVMECTTKPGDAIFVPHGWWHMAINLDGGMNVAVTHNYVSSPSNLGNALRFMQKYPDQISGCRDRPDSIKPDKLRAEFCEALMREEGGRMVVRRAMAQEAFTCRAWKDEDDDDKIQRERAEEEEDGKNNRPFMGGGGPSPSKKRKRTAGSGTTSVMAKAKASIVGAAPAAAAAAAEHGDDHDATAATSSSFCFSFVP